MNEDAWIFQCRLLRPEMKKHSGKSEPFAVCVENSRGVCVGRLKKKLQRIKKDYSNQYLQTQGQSYSEGTGTGRHNHWRRGNEGGCGNAT